MSLPDITAHLTTPENPATSLLDSLDWHRCATLHNYILAFGLQNSGREITAAEQQSWWTFHGPRAEALSEHLSPSLTQFLKTAWIGPDVNLHSFFYYVMGLTPPGGMFMNHGEVGGEILTLYSANNLASHPDGVNFDQEGNDAILQMSTLDQMITMSGRQSWYPLETILSVWISMIHIGKIEALSSQQLSSFSGPSRKPWVIHPFSGRQLADTLSVWEVYLQKIESRHPSLMTQTAPSIGLVDDEVLVSLKLPLESFARQFLSRARRPQFKRIAPGLLLPESATFRSLQQYSFPDDPSSETTWPPILLFQGSGTAPSKKPGYRNEDVFPWPFNTSETFPAGLYLAPTLSYQNPFHDSVTLLLPFSLGSNRFAHTSDNQILGSDPQAKGSESSVRGESFSDLYQPGYRFFAEQYGVRLISVLENWTQMVEEGDWEVGEDGVMDSIDAWKHADTEHGRWKFTLPADQW